MSGLFGRSGKIPSSTQYAFSRSPSANIPRSSFNRSHGVKTTFDAGYLIPVLVDEALPGDTFTLRANFFARLSTPIVPFMDNLFCDSFFFAVPIRLLWTNWEKFNGAQTNPGDSTSFTIPQMTSPNVAGGGIAEGSLSDYMGLPTKPLNGGGATDELREKIGKIRAAEKDLEQLEIRKAEAAKKLKEFFS